MNSSTEQCKVLRKPLYDQVKVNIFKVIDVLMLLCKLMIKSFSGATLSFLIGSAMIDFHKLLKFFFVTERIGILSIFQNEFSQNIICDIAIGSLNVS